ncbi:MAG: hypothetical protein U0U69_05575 [Acidimicrobiia bacterium]
MTVDYLSDVEVADRRPSGQATLLGLLVHALDDLRRQVLAVELGDRAHDAVQQHARWRLVDVLADTDELSPGLADCQVDGDVVGPIARQTIDLVDDDVVDVALGLETTEQGLQGWPVGAAG